MQNSTLSKITRDLFPFQFVNIKLYISKIYSLLSPTLVLGVVQLLKQLKSKEIEGIVINKMTYQTFSHNIKDNPRYAMEAKSVENIHVVRTELDYR